MFPISYQAVFQRHELKYLLTAAQKQQILDAMAPYMEPDAYGPTIIRNLYYDTDSYRLIRRSMEKPVYKEKLRVRSYARADADSTVFVELKKKYKSVVYKRRLSLPEGEAMAWLNERQACGRPSQIAREIDSFLDYYGPLHPTVFLSYQREAYAERGGGSFRVTFDERILARQEDLSLACEPDGASLLAPGLVLMELKCSGGLPLWMTGALSRSRSFKTSFSKYGTAYQTLIFPQLKEAYNHA